MPSYRASRMPLLMTCTQSASPGIQVESPDREAADDGTRCHELMASLIGGAPTDFKLMPDDIRPLMFMAWEMWRQLEGFFTRPITELPLSYADEYNRITMTGHPDVISAPTEGEAPDIRLIDWKFGRLEGDHDEQVNAYAFLALQHYPHAERVYVAICRVREQSIDSRYITREEAAAWYVRFLERLKDTTYRPGRHCGHCSRGADCEAKGWLLQQSLAMVKSSDALPDDPEERAVALENLLAAARLVAKATDDAQELVRAEVIAAGGQLGNLRITSQTQRKLSFPAALPILQAELGDDLAPILRASKTDCEKIIGDKAPYRGNGKAIKAFNERLDAAGALRIETIEKLTIINVRKQLGVTA